MKCNLNADIKPAEIWVGISKDSNGNETSHVYKTAVVNDKDGYNISQYCDILFDSMIPCVERLFNNVKTGVEEIANSDAILINDKPISNMYRSYKRIKEFFENVMNSYGDGKLKDEFVEKRLATADYNSLISKYNEQQIHDNKVQKGLAERHDHSYYSDNVHRTYRNYKYEQAIENRNVMYKDIHI